MHGVQGYQIWHSLVSWRSWRPRGFLYFSAFLCISLHFSSFICISHAILCISLNLSRISLHSFVFLCISLNSSLIFHYYHYYSPLFTIIQYYQYYSLLFTINRNWRSVPSSYGRHFFKKSKNTLRENFLMLPPLEKSKTNHPIFWAQASQHQKIVLLGLYFICFKIFNITLHYIAFLRTYVNTYWGQI